MAAFDETPAGAPSAEPAWSLTTALLFVFVWIGLLFLVTAAFMMTAGALTAASQKISFDDAIRSFQTSETSPAQAVAGVGCAGLAWAATFALINRLLRRFSPDAVRRALGLVAPTPRWSIAAAVPLGFVLLLVGEVISQLLNVPADQTPVMRLMKTPWGAASVAFMALAIAPAAEEVFFRGFVFPPMARRFSLGTAMAFNGAVFASVHLMTYGKDGLGFLPPIFLLGFVLSGMRAWTGSIVPPLVAHFVFNATSLILFLLIGPESPTAP